MNYSLIAIRIIDFITGVIETLIAIRFFFRFFGANDTVPFVQWIYQLTYPLIYPFIGIFPSPTLSHGNIFEMSSIIALIIYALIGYFLISLIGRLQQSRQIITKIESE